LTAKQLAQAAAHILEGEIEREDKDDLVSIEAAGKNTKWKRVY
jgi:hypothetical protein